MPKHQRGQKRQAVSTSSQSSTEQKRRRLISTAQVPSSTTMSLDEDRVPIPEKYICPITHTIMRNPVWFLESNKVYERAAVASLNEVGREVFICPLTKKIMEGLNVLPEVMLADEIDQFIKRHPQLEKERYGVQEDYSVIQAALNKWVRNDLDSLIAEIESKQDRDAVLSLTRNVVDNYSKGAVLRLFCSQKGKSELLERLLHWMGEERREGIVLTRGLNQMSALHVACGLGDSAMVTKLLDVLQEDKRAGAIVAQNTQSLNALSLACINGDSAIVAKLLDTLPEAKRAEAIVARDESQRNALHLACHKGDSPMATMLLDALPEAKRAEVIAAQTQNQWNALHVACHYCDCAMVFKLLEALGNQAYAAFSVWINSDNNDGSTLHAIELVSKNTYSTAALSAEDNRLQIMGCLSAKFPKFFEIYSEQTINSWGSNSETDVSKLIKQTELQLARATSTAVALQSGLFSQSQPAVSARSNEADTSRPKSPNT